MATSTKPIFYKKASSLPLWDSNSLSEALGVQVPAGISIANISIDSRTLETQSLFVAIRGEKFNGNEFAVSAIKNGAVLCIVDEITKDVQPFKNQLVKVPDTLEALNKLAMYARNRFQGKIIGITGSVGKTSTKEMLRLVLEDQSEVFASYGNYNNHIGVPLNLVNMPLDTEFAILEMGMSKPGEISHLSKLAKPDIAIVTTVEPAHLQFFNSVSGVAGAKAEIFDGVPPHGIAIINYDNPYHPILVEKAKEKKLKIISFGESPQCDYRLLNYEAKNEKSFIKAECLGWPTNYELGAIGKHLAINSLAVLAASGECKAEKELSARSLIKFKALKGRGAVHHNKKKDITIIDDCYNASPSAVKAALTNLPVYRKKGGRLVAILGNMVDLGSQSVDFYLSLLPHIIENKVDMVYTVGDFMKHLYDKLPANIAGQHTDDATSMVDIVLKELKKTDVVLVKGARRMKMEVILDKLLESD